MAVMLQLATDSSRELRFAHPHRTALIFGVAAAVGALAAWTFIPERTPRLAFGGTLGFMAAASLVGALYRYDLVLDLGQRRWRRRKGFAFAPSSDEGPLDDLEGVVLTIRWVSKGSGNNSRRVPQWVVALEFAGPAWEGPVKVGTRDDEAGGYRLLEEYAKRLRVDAVDRTADDEVRRAWDALDRPLADPGSVAMHTPGGSPDAGGGGLATSAPPATPPVGSGIETSIERGRRRITLPPRGFGFGTAFAGLFGLSFAGMGGLALVAGLGLFGPVTVNGEVTTGPVPLMMILGAVFIAVGLSMLASGLAGSRAREWVVEERHRLLFGTTAMGRTWGRSALPKREIEEVAVRSTARQRRDGGGLRIMGIRVNAGRNAAAAEEVRVRSDDALVRLGGRLSPEAKAWLRDTLADMART